MDGKVAIITRTKNRPLFLKRALESVRNQSYKNYIHIIVNDGGDEAILKKLIEDTESSIRVITIDSGGYMEQATNAGIELALSYNIDYITLLDDDDTWSPEYLAIMLKELKFYRQRFPNIEGIVCQSNIVREKVEGNTVTTLDIEPHNKKLPKTGILPYEYLSKLENNFGVNQFLYSTNVLSKISRPIDGSYAIYASTQPVFGDWEFNLRFIQVAEIALIPNYLSFYHQRSGENSILNSEQSLQRKIIKTAICNFYNRQGLRKCQ